MSDNTLRSISIGAFGATALILATASLANPDVENPQRRGPPPEALEACADLAEGSACYFTGRRGEELAGVCFVPPRDDSILACRPDGTPRRRDDDNAANLRD